MFITDLPSPAQSEIVQQATEPENQFITISISAEAWHTVFLKKKKKKG